MFANHLYSKKGVECGFFSFLKGGKFGHFSPFLNEKGIYHLGTTVTGEFFPGKQVDDGSKKKNQSFVKVVATDRKNGSKKGEVVLCLKKAGKFKKAARCFIWKKEIEDWRQDFLNN